MEIQKNTFQNRKKNKTPEGFFKTIGLKGIETKII